MQKIQLNKLQLTKGASIQEQEEGSGIFRLSKEGAGFLLPQLMTCEERYLTFRIEVLEEHSLAMNLLAYVHEEMEEEHSMEEKHSMEEGHSMEEERKPAFTVRLGLLPRVETTVCIDLNWMDAGELFPEALPGTLKIVCHGRRVSREELSEIVLSSMPAFHDVKLRISDMMLTDTYPEQTLPDRKLVDRFGQSTWKEWTGKVKSDADLKLRLEAQLAESGSGYPFENWSAWGGWKEKKLKEGTGYFSKCKQDGRWWLTDPEGYAYFSMGPDCVGLGGDCRIDGVENWLEWLPEQDDPAFGGMLAQAAPRGNRKRGMRQFSFFKANLYRAFGEDWQQKWERMICGQLKKYGMNTLGNWSDGKLLGRLDIPYVTSLPEFPATKQTIFRDFPDVFSEEYAREAESCAQALAARRDDPLMIGYFLRNEPMWAFVDNLVLADEVLYNPADTVCKERLIGFLRERYGEIHRLNAAWGCALEGFESLWEPKRDVSKWTAQSREDMREFSRQMLRAYVEIPVRACRQVDSNHMILGMRWAWISDPDLVTGWESFDVFSINCYAVDPTEKIQHVADLGVDLPVMIGEFHFGALDAGLPATGLEAVKSQHDRGAAYRYYCESVAAHPYGVGCHYFQCYDQFTLGRFDGENYNIGLFDICSCAYPEMLEQIRECSRRVYRIAAGQAPRCEKEAESIPMIAY